MIALRGDLGITSVVRAKSAPKGRAYLEVIATFRDTNARDYLFSRGSYLASYRDVEGRPTCGIRLHIPSHLMNGFKTLEAYGVDLKRMHKNKLRKYIKFDEVEEDLFLQVKHDDDEGWMTFTPSQAKREKAEKNVRKVIKSNIHKSPTHNNSKSDGPAFAGKKTSNSERNRKEERMEEGEETAGSSNGNGRWIPPQRKK